MIPSSRIPVQDPGRQAAGLAGELDEAWGRVRASGWYIRGPEVAAFEAAFAGYCGASGCVAVANGTDALEIALRSLGVGPGDEVVTVANAGMYTTAACLQVGAVPVFVDVEPERLTICPESTARMVGPRTAAVVVTHLFGCVGGIDEIRSRIGSQVPILEDCAQAHGAGTPDRRVGSMGDVATFSFYPTKNLGALGDGGAIVSSDQGLLERARSLAQYGWSERFVATRRGGRNSRMDEVQAAVLTVKLPRLDGWNARRRSIVERYSSAAGGEWELVAGANDEWVAHLAVARHPEAPRMREELDGKGVDTAVHYPVPDHRQPALEGVDWRADDLPHTEAQLDRILTLPCFPELSDSECERVCEALRGLR